MATTIDLGPAGHEGVEARCTTSHDNVCWVWIPGTDSDADWAHHVLPFARRREIRAARALVDQLPPYVTAYMIGGHSWGGAIAVMVAWILQDMGEIAWAHSYGGKRAPYPYSNAAGAVSYRHRGDIVPWLPPWRPAPRSETLFGNRARLRDAHSLGAYEDWLKRDGFVDSGLV